MKKLYRSRDDQKIAGICGGLGEIFSIDPTLVRLALLLVALLSGVIPMVIFYIIAWIIIPQKPVEEKADEGK